MNKKRINKNQLVDLFYQYMTESNDEKICLKKISKTESMPIVYFGIHKGEYRFIADKNNVSMRIESYFSDKPDNLQIYIIGSGNISLFNIPRSVYDMIEETLTDNDYL